MSGSKSFISVITPFYNTADYLEECIRSVLAQTHDNFEYILFDNCSTDESGRIAREYAARDARVRYIKASTFVGQMDNYNRALREMSPQSAYCKIVQADDWIAPNCLEQMACIADRNPNVGVVGAYAFYEHRVGHDTLPLTPTGVFPGREAIRLFLLADYGFLGSPTCVMLRSDLVRGRSPFFSKHRPDYEDADACLELLYHCDFAFVYQVLTFNRRSNEGIWNEILRLRPVTLHNYLLVLQHGRKVLAPEEYEQRLSVVQTRYYDLLARACLTPHDRKLWSYHLGALKELGVPLNYGLLAWRLALKLLDLLGNPKRTLEGLGRRAYAWIRKRP